ncbi:hypothetical protein [Kitasatospora purpeofusca]|uniref:hypothetical protein n=1 Tax=Kitasatospora purpeofusca TaxID=67352 RepID=UPI002A5A0B6C|nr:hypothetical protein [Kitasatospora purpeofusca]MDY0814800.1 hypothetical protein [Kitasatospora purpeofusca]
MAFDDLLINHSRAKKWPSRAGGPFSLEPPLRFGDRGELPSIGQLAGAVEKLQQALRVISVGIDYSRSVAIARAWGRAR